MQTKSVTFVHTYKCTGATVHRTVGAAAHLPVAFEPAGDGFNQSVTHGQCDARPTVTFLALEHSPPFH